MSKKFSWGRRVTRRIKRFFNSRRGRTFIISALALGTTIAVAYHPFTRKIVIGYWSRFNNLFNSVNEESTTSIPLVETSSKPSTPTWKKFGLFGGIVVILGVALWSNKIELDDFKFFSPKDEVVTIPSKSYDPLSWDSYPLPPGRRGWLIVARTVGGTALFVLAIPVGMAMNSVELVGLMQTTGWQMATWPIYN